jgi:hypothetical protein
MKGNIMIKLLILLFALLFSSPVYAQQQQPEEMIGILCDTPQQIKQVIMLIERDDIPLEEAINGINKTNNSAACGRLKFGGIRGPVVDEFEVTPGQHVEIFKVMVINVFNFKTEKWEDLKKPTLQFAGSAKEDTKS